MLRYQGSKVACSRQYDWIADAMGINRASVVRAIAQLREIGYIRPATQDELSRLDAKTEKHGEHGGNTKAWVCLFRIQSTVAK